MVKILIGQVGITLTQDIVGSLDPFFYQYGMTPPFSFGIRFWQSSSGSGAIPFCTCSVVTKVRNVS